MPPRGDGNTTSQRRLSIGASIVLYRSRATEIRRLVDQLLKQGAARVYIIDNSPLEFPTFENWQSHPDVFTVRTGRNVGYGRGHNIAIKDSVNRHVYHLVCNPDIELTDNALSKLHTLLEDRHEVGLCMPKVLGLDGSLQYLCRRQPLPLDYLSMMVSPKHWGARRRFLLEMRDRSYDAEMEVECLSGCFMFFRASVLAKLGGFDERFFLYFEDFDLSQRARYTAVNLYWPGTSVLHEHRRAHGHSVRLRAVFLWSAAQFFCKWGWMSRTGER